MDINGSVSKIQLCFRKWLLHKRIQEIELLKNAQIKNAMDLIVYDIFINPVVKELTDKCLHMITQI